MQKLCVKEIRTTKQDRKRMKGLKMINPMEQEGDCCESCPEYVPPITVKHNTDKRTKTSGMESNISTRETCHYSAA